MKNLRQTRILLTMCALAAATLSACQDDSHPKSALPVTSARLGNKTFELEIANTDITRQTGLMRRDSMPDNHGMIFVFDKARILPFYMRNTRIPLDIVFIADDGRVVAIKQMKPYDLSITSSDRPAKWAIELNQGATSSAGLKVGDKLDIPKDARNSID